MIKFNITAEMDSKKFKPTKVECVDPCIVSLG